MAKRVLRMCALLTGAFLLAHLSWWISELHVGHDSYNSSSQGLRQTPGNDLEASGPDNRREFGELMTGPFLPPYNIFAAFWNIDEASHGSGMYARNLLAALLRVAPLRFPPLEPNDHTAAIFLQGLDPLSISWLQRFGPDHRVRRDGRVFVGAFAVNTWDWLPDATTLLNGTVYLAETLSNYRGCEDFVKSKNIASEGQPPFRMRCARVPTGVDVGALSPVLPRENRTLPVVYVKQHSGVSINETKLLDVAVRRAGVHAFTLLRTSHGGEELFSREQYIEALTQAPFMVAFSPGDNWSNFLLEAAAMDVPFFVMTGWAPTWIRKEHGEVHIVPHKHAQDWDEADVVQRLKLFIADLPRYTPREAVSRDLSLDAVGRIVTDVVFNGGKGMVHDF